MIHVFTSAAPNYVGKVRTLCRSLRRYFPEARVHWLIADLRNEDLVRSLDAGEVDEITFAEDLDLSSPTWLFQHDLIELSTAIKPHFARSLLERPDADLVLYFDPDIVLFSQLDDVKKTLSESSLVLTPHLLKPEIEPDAVRDHELCSLRHGVFNLGFFGVRNCQEGRAFLNWWNDRCQEFCWGDWQTGVFTDQKWINFAPAFFPNTSILRSPRHNVAPWNINQRVVEGTFDEGFTVDGEPLGFYHFTGFDSGAHRQVIDKYAHGNEAVHALHRWYEERTRFLLADCNLEWNLGRYRNQKPIEAFHREIYRQRDDLRQHFPDPYQINETGAGYLAWLETQGCLEFPQLAADS